MDTYSPVARVTRRRMLSLMTLALSAFVALGAMPAMAAPPSKVTVVAAGEIQPTGNPLVFELEGFAVGTRVGAMRYDGLVQITDIDEETGVITDTLTETFTAPNGDTLTILCIQVATPVADGVYEGVDTWTVIGGTGKYAGATGSGTGTTQVDLNNLTFGKQLTGVISVKP